MEELKKEIFRILTTTKIDTEDPATQFMGFIQFYANLCEQLEKAHSIGYDRGCSDGVNFSVKIKEN